MRRLLVLLVASGLVFSGLSMVSAVTPKAGVACKKLGAVAVAGGKEFKCIKQGNKRVWSKGVTVKASPKVTPTPTSSPAASPTVTSSPTPVQSPTATTSVAASPSATVSPTPTVTPTPTSTVREYTRAEVSQRNTATNCWTIINESIYDLTSWINSHPGGPSAIRSLCGADGTTSFGGMHGNASDPMRELNRRYVGKLKS